MNIKNIHKKRRGKTRRGWESSARKTKRFHCHPMALEKLKYCR